MTIPIAEAFYRSTPRTSVIITSFNYAEYLSTAIASVLAQSDPDFELIIVDDGSTDGSYEIARCSTDSRIRVLLQPNRGLGAARNTGLEAARGDFITFLDADDIWVPTKLATQVAFMLSHPDTGLVYCRFGVIDSDGVTLSSGSSRLTLKPSGFIIRALLVGNVIGTPSTICFRRELIEDGALRFDESRLYMEDWHFYLRLAVKTRIKFLDSTLAYHRQHSRNMSGQIQTATAQALRTAQFGLVLAGQYLSLSDKSLKRLERQALAYVEAVMAREYAKVGHLGQTRIHAARALRYAPLRTRELLLYWLASIGWMPKAITARLK